MTRGHHRRRFLQLAGTGAAASIAGCTDVAFLNGEGDEGGADEGDDRLTAIVQPAYADIEDLYDQLEAGEIDQLELREEAQQLQQDAIADFEALVDDEELTIEKSTEDVEGVYLIDGSDEAVLGAIRSGPVTELYEAIAYDLILEQQQQQPQPEPENESGGESDNESTEGAGDDGNDAEDGSNEDGDETSDADANES